MLTDFINIGDQVAGCVGTGFTGWRALPGAALIEGNDTVIKRDRTLRPLFDECLPRAPHATGSAAPLPGYRKSADAAYAEMKPARTDFQGFCMGALKACGRKAVNHFNFSLRNNDVSMRTHSL
jgi:hypothetical protein